MITRKILSGSLGAIMIALFMHAAGATLVTYTGTNGLSASADYSLLGGGTQLQIVLTNTSTPAYGGGGANMVLSSLNMDLAPVTFTDGSVALNGGSNIVHRSGTNWVNVATPPDLNEEYAYSNTGVGNSGGSSIAICLNAITSHSNGGNALIHFDDNTNGPLPGGLDYGLVATGSAGFGNNSFVLNSVILTMTLSSALADLSFLNNGSYVEFGSDFLYVRNDNNPNNPPDEGNPPVPEPATLSLIGLGLSGLAIRRRRRVA